MGEVSCHPALAIVSGEVTSTAKLLSASVIHSAQIRSLHQGSSRLPRKTWHKVWVRVQL